MEIELSEFYDEDELVGLTKKEIHNNNNNNNNNIGLFSLRVH